MELSDSGAQLGGELRYLGFLVVCHRDDHVLRFETVITRFHYESAVLLPQALNVRSIAHRQLKSAGVFHKVLGQLVLSWETAAASTEAQAGQPTVTRRAEKPQRVPTVPPRVADSEIVIEDQER